MLPRRLRTLVREPFWLVILSALVLGTLLGYLSVRGEVGDAAVALFGGAWRSTSQEARGALVSMFGIQFTVFTIVLSLNAPMVQSAANQYSPRLVPFYLKSAPLRRAIPFFVLSAGYTLAAVRQLGLHRDEAERARPVLSGAFLLLLVAFFLLTTGLLRTFRFMRVERVLELVRNSTFAAAERVSSRMGRLPLDREARLSLPSDASPLVSPGTGYLVEVDLRRLTRSARQGGVRVRICRVIGDYLDQGEVVGWVATDVPVPLDPQVSRSLAETLTLSPTREPHYDPTYGIRILADVATRALSSSSHDAYTARQALQQMRSILRRLAGRSFQDWNVVDEDGMVRASVMAIRLRELISIAVDAPLRHGASDVELLEGVLEIAREVGLVARDPDDRAAASDLIERVLEDAIHYGNLDRGRFRHLQEEADRIRASLASDAPQSERQARLDWALMREENAPLPDDTPNRH